MRYAIFDLDGTVVDSMGYWRGFIKAFLEEKGIEMKQEIARTIKVKWTDALCRRLKEQYDIDITPQELFDWVIDYVMKRYGEKVEFKPGAKQLLDRLKDEGVKMCICSSTDRQMMEPVLKRLDLDKYFVFTQHCRAYGKEKNEPDIFMDCMARLGAENPREVAVFEDALYSASTAKAAGFYVVGMYDVTEERTDELKELADQYVTDYAQLNFEKLPL